MNDNGKTIVGFHTVRGAVVTASVSLTNGTAATLLAGDTDYFLDLVEISLSTTSTAGKAEVALKNDGTTIRTYNSSGASNSYPVQHLVPLKQLTKGTPWTVDMDDITGTTVVVDALFIKHPGT